MKTLSPRQDEIIRLVSNGETDKEIASRLGIKPETVSLHVSLFIKKLEAKNRVHAVAKYWRRF